MSDFAMKVKPEKIMAITPSFKMAAGTGGKSFESSLSPCSHKKGVRINKIASTKTATPEQADDSNFSSVAQIQTMFLASTRQFEKN